MERGDPETASYEKIYLDDFQKFAQRMLAEGDVNSAFQSLLLGFWELNQPMRTISRSKYFITSYIDYKHGPEAEMLLDQLVNLLDLSNSGDIILAAEIARERSRFDESNELLKSLKSDDMEITRFSNFISECLDQFLPIVRPLPWR